MGTLPKPQLRRLYSGSFKMDMAKIIGAALLASLSFKYLYAEPKKRKYVEFYKTYDPEKSLQRMIDGGYMHANGEKK